VQRQPLDPRDREIRDEIRFYLEERARYGWGLLPADVRSLPEVQGRRAVPSLEVLSGSRGIAGNFGVEPGAPVAQLSAALVMLSMGVAAAYVPARRAAHVDPMVAPRGDG
jgi:hypothetical protein